MSSFFNAAEARRCQLVPPSRTPFLGTAGDSVVWLILHLTSAVPTGLSLACPAMRRAEEGQASAMHIESINLTGFKRFTDTTISGIPELQLNHPNNSWLCLVVHSQIND